MNPKDWIDLANERGIRFTPMFELLKRGVYEAAQEAIDRVWQGTRLSVCELQLQRHGRLRRAGSYIDRAGRTESREMMRIAEMIGRQKTLSVIDVSELCPVFDVSGTAARLAVCVVTRIMAALAKERGEEIDASIRRSDLMRG